jgi:hypothetical protein
MTSLQRLKLILTPNLPQSRENLTRLEIKNWLDTEMNIRYVWDRFVFYFGIDRTALNSSFDEVTPGLNWLGVTSF